MWEMLHLLPDLEAKFTDVKSAIKNVSAILLKSLKSFDCRPIR